MTKIAEFHEGQADQIPAEVREARTWGAHLKLTRINDFTIGVMQNPVIEQAESVEVEGIRITVWFGGQMIDLVMDPETSVAWEVHS